MKIFLCECPGGAGQFLHLEPVVPDTVAMRSNFIQNLSFIFLILFLFSCNRTDPSGNASSIPGSLFVDSEGGLSVYTEPRIDSTPLVIVPDGREVYAMEQTGEDLVSRGRRGKWTRISFEHTEGWVFGGYLSKLKKPDVEAGILTDSDLAGKEFTLPSDAFRILFLKSKQFTGNCTNMQNETIHFSGEWENTGFNRVWIKGKTSAETDSNQGIENTIQFKLKSNSWYIYSLIDTVDPCGNIIESGIWIGESGRESHFWKEIP